MQQQQDMKLTEQIVIAHTVGRGTYGTKRLQIELASQGFRASRRRIARLRDAAGLSVKTFHRKAHTTNSNHEFPICANVLERDFVAPAPDLVWVSDTTEFKVDTHRVYLCTILDLFSSTHVGHAISRHNDAQLVKSALLKAVEHRQPEIGCVFHSDRGSTYAAHDVREFLHDKAFVQSMSRRANCWDNAVAESAFARIKCEIGETFESDLLATRAIDEYLTIFHNHIRIHTRIGMAPASFESKMAKAA